ncbi:MAG: hypothetical protein KQH67_10855 [Bacteroidetes bacterium]|nr:hypothetical protein [Bacteroidota bacterium]
MENLAKKILISETIQPPDSCLQQFDENFPGAINIDWFKKEHYYEAIFYQDDIEHIAHYSKEGILESYKMFMPAKFLPESIKTKLEHKGEIMNVVLINKGNSINYEVIIRNQNLCRYLILLTDLGKVISEMQL